MSRKSLVVVMNCQGQEIVRYLRSITAVACQYEISYISSIVLDDDSEVKKKALLLLSSAHVVVAQDVSSVPWLRNDYIQTIIPGYCRFFRFCFWRFYGYWPMPAEKFHSQMWYVCDEAGSQSSLTDYLDISVDPQKIHLNLEEQIEKFAYIERFSELKMLPFFLENYQNRKMFTDEWHPTSIFFHKVARYIVNELGFDVNVRLLADDGLDNYRHRFVLNAVSQELSLQYDQTYYQYHDFSLSRDVLFEYFKFSSASYDRHIPWLYPRNSFQQWCFLRDLEAGEVDVSPNAKSSVLQQSKVRYGTEWPKKYLKKIFKRLNDERTREVQSFLIDLRDFHRISSLKVWLDVIEMSEPVSLPLSTSLDARTWEKIAVVRLIPNSFNRDDPIDLVFDDAQYARYIKLDWAGNDGVSVRSVDTSIRAVISNRV